MTASETPSVAIDKVPNGLASGVPTWAVLLICFVLTALFNYQFVWHCRTSQILKLNDVSDIIAGYHRSPTLGQACIRYLTKSWIQSDIFAFRPLAGCLDWVDTYVGFHYGFLWPALFGFLLAVICATLVALITYRLTGSKWSMLIAAVLGSTFRFYNVGQPDYWLAWYPCHHDILAMDFVLGAILAFDIWLVEGKMSAQLAMWVCLILGCLTKESAYILPAYMGMIAFFRPAIDVRHRRDAFLSAAAGVGIVVALMCYRRVLYVHPRDPHFFRAAVILHKPIMFMYSTIGKRLIVGDYWFVGLGLLLAGMIGLAIHLRARGKKFGVFGRLYVWLPISLAIIVGYIRLTYGSPFQALWYFCDEAPDARLDIASVLAMLYAIVLVIKYRSLPEAVLAWTFVALAYVPVLSYTGWHYTIPGALMRAVYWGVLANLFWRDIAGYMPTYPAQAALPVPVQEV